MTATARLCDADGVATASHEYIHPSFSDPLTFCDHHARKHETKLSEQGWAELVVVTEPEQSTALVPAASSGFTAEGSEI